MIVLIAGGIIIFALSLIGWALVLLWKDKKLRSALKKIEKSDKKLLLAGLLLMISLPVLKDHPQSRAYIGEATIPIFENLAIVLTVGVLVKVFEKLSKK